MMEFLQISIGEIKRKLKKKKIASYGSRFDEEMSKIGRFRGLGMEKVSLAVDPSMIKVVLEWESPKSVFEIKSFLSLVGYYRRFIEGCSKLALPLTKLTRKG